MCFDKRIWKRVPSNGRFLEGHTSGTRVQRKVAFSMMGNANAAANGDRVVLEYMMII